MYSWDTSALVKQFIQEVGTGEALALRADAPPHATATLAYTETFSASRRRVREAALNEPHYHEVVRRFFTGVACLRQDQLGRQYPGTIQNTTGTTPAPHPRRYSSRVSNRAARSVAGTVRDDLSRRTTPQSRNGRTSRNEAYPVVSPSA